MCLVLICQVSFSSRIVLRLYGTFALLHCVLSIPLAHTPPPTLDLWDAL